MGECRGGCRQAIVVSLDVYRYIGRYHSWWKDLTQCITGTLAQLVWEFHSEVQDHVSPLLRTLGQGQSFSHYALLHPRFDHVSGCHSDSPAVQRGSIDSASTQCLVGEMGRQIHHSCLVHCC